MIQMRVQGAIICTCEKGSEGIDLLDSFSIPHIAVDSYPDYYQCCGFNDIKSFYKVFRKMMLLTPGEYRNRLAGIKCSS